MTVAAPGTFGFSAFGAGAFGTGGEAPIVMLQPASPADTFAFGRFGRRVARVVPATTGYPDRFGTGCWGRRERAAFVPVGRALAVSSYLAIGRVGSSGALAFTLAGEVAPSAATLLPRLRAPVVYVLDESRQTIAVIDGYESFAWEDRWREPDEWALRVNIHVSGATALADGVYIAVPLPDGSLRVGLIEGRALGVDGHEDTEVAEVTGRCYGSALEGRLAITNTAVGNGYDTWTKTRGSAADAMVYYVTANAIGTEENPTAWRTVPNLAIGTVPATAERVSFNARFQPLTEVLAEIGQATGLGWRVRYDEATGRFLFEPLVGRDMTSDVAFSPVYGNVASIGVAHDERTARTVAYVAGQGEGAFRKIQQVWEPAMPAAPSGLAVRELFVDARDIDEESRDTLESRGLAKLAEAPVVDTFEFELLNGGPYDYPADFQVGDVVRAEYPGWAHEEARIVACRQQWDEDGRAVSVTVGAEPPDVGSVVVNLARRQAVRGRE